MMTPTRRTVIFEVSPATPAGPLDAAHPEIVIAEIPDTGERIPIAPPVAALLRRAGVIEEITH